MKIATKLSLFYAAVLVVFSLLAFALERNLHSVSTGYDSLLQSPVRQMDEARTLQVEFKKQVQEWKDILLRGHNPEDLAKYTRQFHEREENVRAGAQALSDRTEDTEAKQLLSDFVAAHAVLSQRYQQAYDAYVQDNFDFKTADKIVRGQDRPPTDLFDRAVARLDARVKSAVAAQTQQAAHSRNVALSAAGGLLILLGVVGLLLVHDILGRLGRLKAVSDRLAMADISGLAIDVSGHDEIAAFGASMKGVHAAIEELLHTSSAETAVR
jgi:CHASE3 domain sensor protein